MPLAGEQGNRGALPTGVQDAFAAGGLRLQPPLIGERKHDVRRRNQLSIRKHDWCVSRTLLIFHNRELLATLCQAGYRGPIGLTCYGIQGDAREHLQRSMEVWKGWKAEWGKE